MFKERKAKQKEYYQKNKEILKEKARARYKENREANIIQKQIYRESNKELINERQRNYYYNNKSKITEAKRIYSKNKRANNPFYKMKCNLRRRALLAFNRKSWVKGGNTEKLLKGSFEEVFSYLESKFTKGMSWDNRDTWHTDHIIPLSSATTKEELEKLMNYRNLQPLWAEDNLKKGSTYGE